MTQIKLKKLLSKRNEAVAIVKALIEALNTPFSIQDIEGNILIGAVGNGFQGRYPITCGNDIIGWTVGQEGVELAAMLLTHLANKEAERDTLADEMLERYRELNLLYHLSEKLAASLELAAVAQTALDEGRRLIRATAGCVMSLDEGQGRLETVVAFGQGFQSEQGIEAVQSIIHRVVRSGKAELVNEIQANGRYDKGEASTSISSIVCAPLKAKDRIIGVIALGVEDIPITYIAADLKLLNTVTSQAAPAIENAFLHEKALREAREREERLRRQIEDLRIELDEARQAKQVAEITESDYFQHLRHQADNLREIIEKP